MHLLEAQSLAAGQQIDKINIYEKYFPLPFDKYIVFQPWSKNSKNYDLWLEVLNIIVPVLQKNGIQIVQIGANNERPLVGTYNIAGQTNIGQIAYLIKRSLLFFGTDSFGQHLAGHYNIPLVDLISNNYSDVVRPFFGDRNNQVILEPPRENNEKPSFSLEEHPKSINRIKPEDIANNILKLLNLDNPWPYQQLYLGDIFISPMVISTCDHLVNHQQFGIDKLIIDLSFNYKEDVLLQQMQICDLSIITNRPLSSQILDFHYKTKRIKEIVYIIEENNDPNFIKSCIKYGIPFRMISKLPNNIINELKLSYFEYGVIWPIKIFNPLEIPAFKDTKLDDLSFRSGKFYIGRGKLYPSRAHYLEDKPTESFDAVNNILNKDDFWQELDSFRILEKYK